MLCFCGRNMNLCGGGDYCRMSQGSAVPLRRQARVVVINLGSVGEWVWFFSPPPLTSPLNKEEKSGILLAGIPR